MGDAKPDEQVIRSLIRLAWASCRGDYQLLLNTTWEEMSSAHLTTGAAQLEDNEYSEDTQLCKYE